MISSTRVYEHGPFLYRDVVRMHHHTIITTTGAHLAELDRPRPSLGWALSGPALALKDTHLVGAQGRETEKGRVFRGVTAIRSMYVISLAARIEGP